MVALGPRVGGAHVDVNLKFDEKSIGRVGKQIHRQLSKLGDNLVRVGERNRDVYRALGRDAVTAWRAILGVVMSGAPLIGSAISGLSGAVTMLAGSFYSAVQSTYGLAPLLTAIGIAAGTASIGMNGFVEAVRSGDLSKLTPSARESAKAVRSLQGAWKRLRDTVQERMFAGLADSIRQLSGTLFPVLELGLGKMADAINVLVKSLLDYVNSAAGLKQIGDLLDNSADIFRRLSRAAVPFLDGLLKLLNALAPAGKRLADRIADIAKRFQEWASASDFAERIDNMMKRAEKTAGLLFKVIRNLGGAIANIFNAANPATNSFLEMLIGVTQRFKDWSESVEGKSSIAEWAENSVEVMRQFGKTLEAVFKVIAELSDPRVIISFLKTVEEAFDYLGKLPLDKMVSAFVKMAEALQPISSIFLAVIIAAAAFNVIIGSIIGQVAGLARPLILMFKPLQSAGKHGKTLTGISAAFARIEKAIGGIVRPILLFFGPLASAGKHGKELSGLAGAFARIAGIAARMAKVIPLAGWAIWIGMVIAKSKDLQKKLGEVWDAVKEVGAAIGDAFKEISEALKPLTPAVEGVGKAFGWFFDILDDLLEVVLMISFEGMIRTFKGLASVISGVSGVIAGFINLLVGLFTLDPEKMLKGLGQLGSGIMKIFGGIGRIMTANLVGIFKTLGGDVVDGFMSGLTAIWDAIKDFGRWIIDGVKSILGISSPSTVFMEIGVWVVEGFIQGIVSMFGALFSLFESMVSGIIGIVMKLPGLLFSLGFNAIKGLGKAILGGLPSVVGAAGKVVSGVVGSVAKMPGRLFSLGTSAVGKLGGAIKNGVSSVTGAAGSVVKGAVGAVTGMPGRLFSLGKSAVEKLAGAVKGGVGRLKGIAGDIKDAVLGVIAGLSGEMLNIGKNIIGNLTSGISSGFGALKGAAGKIGGFIKGVLPGSPVEYGPLTAWNRGNGATGGGRNVIDAITAGLKDTSSIKKAMSDVSNAVSASLIPTVGTGALVGGGASVTTNRSLSVTINNPQAETGSDSLTRTTRNLAYLGLA